LTCFVNQPARPPELQILEVLRSRTTLSSDSTTFYHSLKKGYEGETKWHSLLKRKLSTDSMILYDLLLDRSDSLFQLDCLIIQQRTIWHLEIKNYDGDFMMKNDKMYKLPNEYEVNNPLNQIERGQRLMKDLLKKYAYHFPIESFAVFIHPEFALYHVHRNMPIVMPTQINRFITTINQTPSSLNSAHRKLAHELLSLRTSRPLSKRLPEYEFDQLEKGIPCVKCNGWMVAGNKSGRKLICEVCGNLESRESSVLRNTEEFCILFPNQKITTLRIWEWCGGILSKFKIRGILSQYLQPIGSRSNMHFISPFNDRLSK